jgi:hypothetical protein
MTAHYTLHQCYVAVTFSSQQQSENKQCPHKHTLPAGLQTNRSAHVAIISGQLSHLNWQRLCKTLAVQWQLNIALRCDIWGARSDFVPFQRSFHSSVMWCCTTGQIILDISKNSSAFHFRVKQFKKNVGWPWRWRHYEPVKCWAVLAQKHGVTSHSSVTYSRCVP